MRMLTIKAGRMFAMTASLLFAGTLAGAARGATPGQLGKIDFPTSCSKEAQPELEKGLALLHSFQYKESEADFTEAVKRDPKCAIGYWGQAMAHYYQLWEFPDDKTMKQGRKDLQRAQKLRPAGAREQALVNSGAVFFQKKKMSHAERIQAYSTTLEKAHEQASEDVELSSFYALSLIALSEEDVDDMANRKKAIAILTPLLEKYPNHPGVAHYLIHAADKPELAPEGLQAARRYAAIAPDSAHALHMPSHIFVRLGLWQDSIQSNIAANESGAHAAEQHMAEAHYQTHAMDFLNYSYLQSGQEAKARAVIDHTSHIVGASDEDKMDDQAYLAARTALELHRWKEAAELTRPAIHDKWQDATVWAKAIGAARSGDIQAAQTGVEDLRELVSEREKRMTKNGYNVSNEKATDLREAEAWLAFAQGKNDEALTEMHAAADHQDKEGGESVNIPAREMLADMLMEMKRPKEAQAEYALELKSAPNRFDGLLGAARAAQANGDASGAQTYFAKLVENCGAGADRPELAEAKTVLAKK
jgi:tetratricopeptide (TPR) repeat protein